MHGARCHDCEGGSTWKTQEVVKELALKLRQDHIKYAHQATVARAHQGDGASGADAQDEIIVKP